MRAISHQRALTLPVSVLGFLVLVAFALVGIAWGVRDWQATLYHGDFGIFWQVGVAALHGQPPYAVPPVPAKNLNPPFSVLLFAPFGLLDEDAAYWLWTTLSVACYLLTLFLTTRLAPHALTPVRFVWTVAFAPLWYALARGQVEIVMLPLVVGVVLLQRSGRTRWAGVLLGLLVAFKPILAVWALAFLLSGETVLFASAALSGAVASLLPAMLFGPSVYLGWLAAIQEAHAIIASSPNGSLSYQFGVPVAVLVALFVLGVIWRYRPDVPTMSALAIALALLISPVAWATYSVLLVPFILTRRWAWAMLGAFYLVPVLAWGEESIGIVYLSLTAAILLLTITSFIRPWLPQTLASNSQTP